jgi:predicted transcriptional regulator
MGVLPAFPLVAKLILIMRDSDALPPLRVTASEAIATVKRRVDEGAKLFLNDQRYSREMHQRFDAWYQATAGDLEYLYWSDQIANWFRTGTFWQADSGNFHGVVATRNDRISVLEEILRIITSSQASATAVQYDVALSFANEQRSYVEQVALELRRSNIRTFYDRDAQVDLWGKNLYEHLSSVYRDQARYCVIFISQEYAAKQWTSHERQSAQARAFREHREYILPARFDDTELPGLNEAVGYVDIREMSPTQLAELIAEKLRTANGSTSVRAMPTSSRAAHMSTVQAALVAVWDRRIRYVDGDYQHEMLIYLYNNRASKCDDWKLQVWFPSAFLAASARDMSYVEKHEGDFDVGRIYPGELFYVLTIEYSPHSSSWEPTSPKNTDKMRICVRSGDDSPWEVRVAIDELLTS